MNPPRPPRRGGGIHEPVRRPIVEEHGRPARGKYGWSPGPGRSRVVTAPTVSPGWRRGSDWTLSALGCKTPRRLASPSPLGNAHAPSHTSFPPHRAIHDMRDRSADRARVGRSHLAVISEAVMTSARETGVKWSAGAYVNCPRRDSSIRPKAGWLVIEHCPRCLACARIAARLFRSPLPVTHDTRSAPLADRRGGAEPEGSGSR